MNKKGDTILLAKKEWAKESNERKIHYLLLSLAVISFLLFASVLLANFIRTSGLATYIEGRAGEITELSIEGSMPVNVWGGFYGLALRVPGVFEQFSKDLPGGSIQRSDVFFDCLKVDAQGGPEMYASTNPSLDLISSNVIPATIEMINSFINCTDNAAFCAENTFTQNATLYLGSEKIENIPSTYTYGLNGNKIFDVGALNVSGELVFFAHVNATVQKGFNPNTIVNYQLLLPTPANQTQTYYFYSDPFDACAAGGIGTTMNLSIAGFIFDEDGLPIANASVTLAGYSVLSNASGFYNVSALVLEGNYTLVSKKTGFKNYAEKIYVNFSIPYMEINITMTKDYTQPDAIIVTVNGSVTDTGGNYLSDVLIYFGNASTLSDYYGDYSITSYAYPGQDPIFAIKQDYDNYYAILEINSSGLVDHDIILEPANLNTFMTGPYTEQKRSNQVRRIQQVAVKAGQDYWISTKEINKQVRQNTFIEDTIDMYNFKQNDMSALFTVSPEIQDILKLDKNLLVVAPNTGSSIKVTIAGTKPIGIYRGTIKVSGDLEQEIPVKIEIVPQNVPIQNMRMELSLYSSTATPGSDLRYKLNLKNLLTDYSYQVYLKYLVTDTNGTRVFYKDNETVELRDSLDLIRKIPIPANISTGEYHLNVEANYLNLFSTVAAPFTVSTSFYLYSFFGIRLWVILLAAFILSFLLFNLFLYRMHVNKNKRYHLDLDVNTLPKPGDRAIKLGYLAERKTPAYYNLDDLTTHAIIAGATGGGKSISAQVFVEEALMKNIAIIVFDPTAQWSGMLRKCEDKRMLALYSKFGMKESEARAFPGNIRQVTNEKQSIDIKRYINPGNIQVFTMNKLTPSQIDVFVAGVISNIFKSDPKEYPNLRVLLVFDEVHRLLPKFGGSGKGFLQIERACREFRKWGFGVMLVSQVLSDFVGEIKANINTEVQMRVAEENDLERIRERYGDGALKSLVRADVGTGMIQNAEYNRGKPYFVGLRPILHNTRRLSDEILDKYNHYNDIIEDVEYQIEQIESFKVDVSDLKIEIKLIKDKLVIGNFTVVDIYLEGLLPKLEKAWDKLGKRPKKKAIELINVTELESSLVAAQKAREQWQKQNPEKQAVVEVKEQKKSEKIVSPFTFNNGIMISSLKELYETLPSIDASVIAEHVKGNKNELAAWASAQIDSALGNKIKKALSKDALVREIAAFIDAEKSKEKAEEMKEETEENKENSGENQNAEKKEAEKSKDADKKDTKKAKKK